MLDRIYPQLEKILAAKKIREFELFFESRTTREYEAKDSALESAKEAVQRGLALRVFKDERQSFVSTTDLSERGLEDLAEGAAQILPLVDPDPAFGLPENRESSRVELRDWDATLDGVPVARKVQLALDLERNAKASHPRVKTVRSATYAEEQVSWELRNSHGFSGSHRKSECSLMVMAVAENGPDAESSYEFEVSPFFAVLDPEKVGREAGLKAASYLGSVTPPTRRLPVILHPLVATEVFAILTYSFQGDEVFKNRSQLKDKLGQKVYSSHLTVIDDALRSEGLGSAPFDGEGQPGRTLPLMESGVLKNYLVDQFYSRKLGLPANGSSRRSSLKRSPAISHSNWVVQPGSMSDEAIFREAGEAVWVTEAIGMHGSNPISGDFSVGAQGFLIEGGQKTRPVKKFAIAGNLHQMMADVEKVGLHHRFYSNIGAPTLLIRELAISGT